MPRQLQTMLRNAVQSVQWTYSLFWQLCPQQGVLVWKDGYYNGAIKTRKTVQPMEVSAEEASLHRSQQLRELYDSLSGAGEPNQPARRPSAALSPEDLTESEWFYLMCVSFSFPPGIGLPGKAYSKKHHLWITGANEVESKVFCRAILAKSARIQTVICIPLLEGVLELGTTEKVQEDAGLINHVKSFFIEKKQHQPEKPALSEHSTSNPTNFSDPRFYSDSTPLSAGAVSADQNGRVIEDEEDEEDEDDEDEDQEDDEEAELDSHMIATTQSAANGIAAAEASELMQLDMSEGIRFGSPDDVSNTNMDSDFHMVGVSQAENPADYLRQADSFKPEAEVSWGHFKDLPHLPGGPSYDELSQEDTHYSQTVSTILEHLTNQSSKIPSTITGYIFHTTQTAFTSWSGTTVSSPQLDCGGTSSQWLLKSILFSVPYLHTKYQAETSPKSRDAATVDSSTGSRLRRGGSITQDEPSGNHVLAERRRREKLNERFIILRSLVPFVTKMDKASILGDTIEYVKQLRKKIQDLEAHAPQTEAMQQSKDTGTMKVLQGRGKRRMKMVEASSLVGGKITTSTTEEEEEEAAVQVEVSIIENDALVELKCPYKDGLLLDVMQMLRELKVEVVTIQSSLTSGFILAELRAKVKENIYGRKASILEVKKSIHQLIPRV